METITRSIFEPALGYPDRQVFALIDTAADSSLYPMACAFPGQSANLFTGLAGTEGLQGVAPWLMRLDRKDTDGMNAFTAVPWRSHWGMFIISKHDFSDLSGHLKKNLLIRDTENRRLLFRYYDPRVFINYMETGNPEDIHALTGTGSLFVMEDNNNKKISFGT